MEESGSMAPDIDIVALLKGKVDSLDEGVTITENEDGSLAVKVLLTAEEFADEFEELVGDFSESMTGASSDLNFKDTTMELVVDKDNNITNIKFGMDLDVTIEGQAAKTVYNFEFIFNPIGENFTVEGPADLDEYEEIDGM